MHNLDSFNELGYVVIKNGVTSELISDFLDDANKLLSNNREELESRVLLVNERLFRVVNLHMISNAARRLFSNSSNEATDLVDKILGGACVYTSLYFESGSEQPLHRDTPYFWTNPPYNYLGFWVALEDVHASNGMLTLIEKSHTIGEPDILKLRQARFFDKNCPSSDDQLFADYNVAVKKICDDNRLKSINLPMQKGDILIWNASTMHGGMPHIDKKISRKSIVFHLTPKNMPVTHMDYFFHPERNMPKKSEWKFYSDHGRWYASHPTISFMHKIDVPISNIKESFKVSW